MASRTKYSEEFRKKVVDEYKKGDLSLDGAAAKYGLPTAIVQDWVNKDNFNGYIVSNVDKPKEKKTIVRIVLLIFQRLKSCGWLLAACLPLIILLVVSFKFNKRIVESERNDNQQTVQEKLDTLISVYNELNDNIVKLGITLEKIDNEMELKLVPSVTINNDNYKHLTHKTKFINKTKVKVGVDENVDVGYSVNVGKDSVVVDKPNVITDSCCCRCNKNTIK